MFVTFELMIFRLYYVNVLSLSLSVSLSMDISLSLSMEISISNVPYSTINCTFSTENVGNSIKGWVVTPHWERSCRKTRHWQLQRRRVPVF